MRLARMTDYAIRLLIYLAQRPDRQCTIAEVATAHAISEAHLMKITQQLGQAGWLVNTRGRGGGIRLAKPPADIRLGEVVRTMEPDFHVVECFSGETSCTLIGNCAVTGVIDGALRSFMDYLNRYTLADVLPPPPGAARPIRLQRRKTAPSA